MCTNMYNVINFCKFILETKLFQYCYKLIKIVIKTIMILKIHILPYVTLFEHLTVLFRFLKHEFLMFFVMWFYDESLFKTYFSL